MAIARRSVKRESMLALLRSVKCHPPAEWVYARLREEYPDVSLGTVYRNLRQLTEEGLIASVGVIGGLERFDGNVEPHGHFVCDRCGAVLDVDLPELCLPESGSDFPGTVTGVDVKLHGICANCLEDIRE